MHIYYFYMSHMFMWSPLECSQEYKEGRSEENGSEINSKKETKGKDSTGIDYDSWL